MNISNEKQPALIEIRYKNSYINNHFRLNTSDYTTNERKDEIILEDGGKYEVVSVYYRYLTKNLQNRKKK